MIRKLRYYKNRLVNNFNGLSRNAKSVVMTMITVCLLSLGISIIIIFSLWEFIVSILLFGVCFIVIFAAFNEYFDKG